MEKGQILIEVLIALVAVGMAVVALLYGLSNTVLAVNTVANSRTAMNLARSQMEYIQAQSFNPLIREDLQDESNPAYAAYLKLPRRSLPTDISPDDIDITVVQESPYLQHITISVSYVKSDATLEDYKPNHNELGYDDILGLGYHTIFANDTEGDDETINIRGSNWRIQGDVLSKSGITLEENNNNKVNGDVTCEDNFEGNDIIDVWGSVLEGDDSDTSEIPPPIDYQEYSELGSVTFWLEDGDDGDSFDDIVNLNLVDEVWFDPAPDPPLPGKIYYTQLREGIYYFEDGKIVLSCSPFQDPDDEKRTVTISGRVTLIAETIEIKASDVSGAENNNLILSPYAKGILAWATEADQQITITANNSILTGTLYAPEGTVVIGDWTGDTPVIDSVIAGMLVANEVELYGEYSSIGF